MTFTLHVSNSATNPIAPDWVPRDVHRLPGTLALCFVPGKKGLGLHTMHDRDLDADLHRLRHRYSVGALVTLLEHHEFEQLGVQALPERARAHHIELVGHPIRDVSVPLVGNPFDALLDGIIERLRAGWTVLVTCRGGLGRTGTVACCALIRLGVPAAIALSAVRRTRPGTVETAEQERFVFEYERWLRPVCPVSRAGRRRRSARID